MKAENGQTQLIQEFSQLSSWEERYELIISMGKKLESYPEQFRNENFKIKGCQSQVWLYAHLDENNKVNFIGDSDAMIVKGLVAILLRVYSGRTPDEILNTKLEFLGTLGLMQHLSPSRANGLNSMLKQIHYYALAFKSL